MNQELPQLSHEEIARYSRHLILPEIGLEGQRRLKNARVLMVGTGGLGAPLGMYLAAAGVGHLGIVDCDTVDSSNLQRQIIHGTKDIGRDKIASAQDRLKDINPFISITPYNTRIDSTNALEIIKDYDIVVDGTDNFPTRYLINDACVLLGKPNVYGSIFRFEGQASIFATKHGPCYRCIYPEPPPPGLVPSCAESGVLGVLPGIIGTIQATEAIKLILGAGDSLVNRLLLYNAWKMSFQSVRIARDPGCPICGDNPTIRSLIDYQQFCGLKKTVPADQSISEISAKELKHRLDLGHHLQLIDVREASEHAIARIPGAKLIPLGQILNRIAELDATQETVIFCKGGVRSAKAIHILRQAAYTGPLLNLSGGITAWSRFVDPNVPLY
jgi:adenylyltransferase/sulfurtransferase